MKNEALDFQELLKVINCMSYDELKEVFFDDVDYYTERLGEIGVFKFICYLDDGNIESLYNYAKNKMNKFKLENK